MNNDDFDYDYYDDYLSKWKEQFDHLEQDTEHDAVNHPSHYTSHPSGVECIEITRHMTNNIGNVIKYCWRSGQKEFADEIEDLEKARFYLDDEIKRLKEITKKIDDSWDDLGDLF